MKSLYVMNVLENKTVVLEKVIELGDNHHVLDEVRAVRFLLEMYDASTHSDKDKYPLMVLRHIAVKHGFEAEDPVVNKAWELL